MPYITASRRAHLESAIDQLKNALRTAGGSTEPAAENKMAPGELNYTITRLSMAFLENHGPLNYHNLALVTGVLENVKQELYRRMVAPYEDRKIAENGDVY